MDGTESASFQPTPQEILRDHSSLEDSGSKKSVRSHVKLQLVKFDGYYQSSYQALTFLNHCCM